MEVDVNHFVDPGERDAAGRYDYYYEGDVYTFVDAGERLAVRVYVENPGTGHFVQTAAQLKTSRLAPAVVN